MKIYLVRHGKALPPEIDPEKGLSPEGKTEAEKIARHLAEKSFPIETIYHSEKLRAKQTAEIFKECIAPHAPLVLLHQMNPNDPIDEVIAHIEASDGDCMFVGHLPFMNAVCTHLKVGEVRFDAATCACLETENGKWKLAWVVRDC